MTPDSFPIFDRFLENVYMIADANHGYKMIGVGELVAKKALSKGIKQVIFDRGGNIYHGRVKALAEAARVAGLNF